MVHLIDDVILESNGRTFVVIPAVGVGGGEVDNSTTTSVHSYRFGKDARGLAHVGTVVLDIEGVELTLEVTLHLASPLTFASFHTLELNFLEHLAVDAGIVDAQRHRLSVIVSVKKESGSLGAIGHLVKIIIASTCCCHSQCNKCC